MNSDYSTLLLISVFLFVIVFNILIISAFINKALVKFIKPEFEEKHLKLVRWQWAGLSTGDFKEGAWRFVTRNGGASKSIYIYLYYVDSGIEQRITARIDILFFSIKKVVCSRKF